MTDIQIIEKPGEIGSLKAGGLIRFAAEFFEKEANVKAFEEYIAEKTKRGENTRKTCGAIRCVDGRTV